MANLFIKSGDQVGTVFRLTGPEVTIGRDVNNTLVLLDRRVSRNHAAIATDGHGYILEDRGSVNGVYVNNTLVKQHVLREGDEIKVGATVMKFSFLNVDQANSPESAAVQMVTDEKSPQGLTVEMRISSDDVRKLIPEGSALDPATLQKAYERLLVLYRLSHELGAMVDLPQLLDKILELALRVTRADRGVIMLLDSLSGEWTSPVVRLKPGVDRKEVPVSRTIVNQVVQTGEAVLTSDASQDQRFQAAESIVFQGIRSAICVPLKSKEKILGIMQVDCQGQDIRFTKPDLELLTAMAAQAAVAIENAQLFTDLKEANHEIKERQAQLIEAEKLSAMGRLAGGVAHEINNPMTCILGYTALVRKDVEKGSMTPEEFRDSAASLKIVEEEAHHCVRIAQSLLQFGRRKTAAMAPTDVNEVMKAVLMIAKFHIKKVAIEIREELDPHLPLIQANAGQLQQVFLNMIVNARDAMEKAGGRLTVSTARKDNQWIEVRFADTGCGIPADKLEEIFKPLYTTKEEGKGTGLGLSISQEIVELHRGTLEVESTVGQGTTFAIRLPL